MHDDHHGHHHDPHGHHDHDDHRHPHPPGHNGRRPCNGRRRICRRTMAPRRRPIRETTDLDLVETAFIEGFSRAPDAASFLRLAGIPFVGESADGMRLHLLRVETEELADVGAVMPLVGGAGVATIRCRRG